MTVVVSSDFTDNEWREYINSHPQATPAHMIEWREVIAGTFGYSPKYMIARRNGKICGALPAFYIKSAILGKHLISVPFLNSGGIIADDEESRRALLDSASNIIRADSCKHLEMRVVSDPIETLPTRHHKVRIVLDLPGDPNLLWKSLRGEIRNRTRHAIDAGLTVDFGSERLSDFYKVFASNMRDLGVPVHPFEFFSNALNALGNAADLVTVRNENEIIGGAITVRFKDTLEVPWVSCSRDHFSLCPNNILYWEIMRQACEDGASLFDFGRSTPATGPATFKLRWGAREEPLHWQYVLAEGGEFPAEVGTSSAKYKLASNIWRRLPVMVTNIVGSRLIKQLPG